MRSGAATLFDSTEDHPVRLVRIIDPCKKLLGCAIDLVDRQRRLDLDAAGPQHVQGAPAHDFGLNCLDPEAGGEKRSGATNDLVVGRQPAARPSAGPTRGERGLEIEQWIEPGSLAAVELDAVTVGNECRHSGNIGSVRPHGKGAADGAADVMVEGLPHGG